MYDKFINFLSLIHLKCIFIEILVLTYTLRSKINKPFDVLITSLNNKVQIMMMLHLSDTSFF